MALPIAGAANRDHPLCVDRASIVCGTLFYRIAEADERSGLLWATLSVAVGAAAHSWLGWGSVGFVVTQMALFAAMFGANAACRRSP